LSLELRRSFGIGVGKVIDFPISNLHIRLGIFCEELVGILSHHKKPSHNEVMPREGTDIRIQARHLRRGCQVSGWHEWHQLGLQGSDLNSFVVPSWRVNLTSNEPAPVVAAIVTRNHSPGGISASFTLSPRVAARMPFFHETMGPTPYSPPANVRDSKNQSASG